MASNVVINFLGDASKFDKTLNGVEGKLGKLGGIAAKAAIAAGTAAAGAAIASTVAYADFDSRMREVYTLMPGMSQKAMRSMEDDVMSFSREFGTLPNDVIPALYDSLSAGVPKDNVFAFLETSQKFAKAGATDVSTAVDGLTTVVNAFGMESSEAGRAADVLFTAVKQGKTTVPELSASMFQVAPIAAAMGVSIEEVAAGFASLTAQGVPTAQAATQMKGAFAELGKQGTKADKAFRDITGKGFPDFIKGGGTVQEALNLMAEGAADSGISVVDMFGSIEAGQAVLGLTGEQAGRFADNLAGMQDSAGAVDEAFGVMNAGLKQKFNVAKAYVVTASLQIGRFLTQYINDGIDKAIEIFGRLRSWWEQNGPAIIAAVQGFADSLRENFEKIREPVERVVNFIRDNATAVFAGLVGGILTFVVPALVTWATTTWALVAAKIALLAPIIAVFAAVALLVGGIVWAYQNFETFRNVIDTVAAFITGTIWPAIQAFAAHIVAAFGDLVAWTKTHWDQIREAIDHVIRVVRTVIETVLGAIAALWRAWGDDLLRVAMTMWDAIRQSVENAIRLVQNIIKTVLAVINGDWGAAWEGIKGILSAVWDQIKNIVSTAFDVLKSIFGGAVSTLQEMWGGAWEDIKSTLSAAWDSIKSGVADGIVALLSFFGKLPGQIVGALGDVASILFNKGKEIVQGMINGIKSMAGSVASAVASAIPGGGVIKGALSKIPGFAKGVTNFQGGLAVVGEDGPELVNLPKGSDVFSHGKSKAMVAGAADSGDGLTREDLMEFAEMLIDGIGEKLGTAAERSARSALQNMRAAGAR